MFAVRLSFVVFVVRLLLFLSSLSSSSSSSPSSLLCWFLFSLYDLYNTTKHPHQDIRAPQPVARFSGSHKNSTSSHVRIALSPCGRYLACGSEDRSARILDLRGSGRELAKLPGHRDVVTGVAFSPLFPQLATCSYDGTVRFYVDPLVDASATQAVGIF